MGLFGLKKKKSEGQGSCCSCQCSCSAPQTEGGTATSAGGSSILVLGTGCASCHTLLENTRRAVDSLGLSTPVEYVTDLAQIAQYGVMRMPGLVVDGKVVSCGKVLKPEEIAALLRQG